MIYATSLVDQVFSIHVLLSRSLALAPLYLGSCLGQNTLFRVVHLVQLVVVHVGTLDHLDLSHFHILDGIDR